MCVKERPQVGMKDKLIPETFDTSGTALASFVLRDDE
jgi:hypothetical protein